MNITFENDKGWRDDGAKKTSPHSFAPVSGRVAWYLCSNGIISSIKQKFGCNDENAIKFPLTRIVRIDNPYPPVA